MVPRQLAAKLVQEPRLVRGEGREGEPEDEIRDVLRAVLRDRQEQEPERPARVVVDPPDQAEVEQREPAVGREQEFPRCGSAW